MDDQTITIISFVVGTLVSLISLAIGFAGFIFGIYKHFSTLRRAKIIYAITELTYYELPSGILDSIITLLDAMPFVMEIQSVGNKQAENVNIGIITASDIREIKVETSETYTETQDTRETHIHFTFLNPGETVKISGQCVKAVNLKDYVESTSVTHSEGVGLAMNFVSVEPTRTFKNFVVRAEEWLEDLL